MRRRVVKRRYVSRGPIALERLSLDADGLVVYELKHPFSDGTTHVLFEPLDFLARLAALVPRPRTHLIRYHGLFAPNAKRPVLSVVFVGLALLRQKVPWRREDVELALDQLRRKVHDHAQMAT